MDSRTQEVDFIHMGHGSLVRYTLLSGAYGTLILFCLDEQSSQAQQSDSAQHDVPSRKGCLCFTLDGEEMACEGRQNPRPTMTSPEAATSSPQTNLSTNFLQSTPSQSRAT